MVRIQPRKCLVLVDDTASGDLVTSLLHRYGWRMQLVCEDREAYEHMLRRQFDVVVADIDAIDLGGLALLAYCHQNVPEMTTYALAQGDDPERKRLARELCGCQGFLYFQRDEMTDAASRIAADAEFHASAAGQDGTPQLLAEEVAA
ncbi:DNA-binding response regulator [Mariprofundus erugo]|uniref:DNA-binding response regulator n=1 Tax=Mariprofundus erugo TaxID=2528639 RepID=A0A5R9GRP6_9PROT|nr:DNA-binding response regulator [Mariprofundus erugo]TLS66682.1 DNA-binding response regulator [Mariprofundus erugo]TLS74551.1 DNA-binding response regulator [Mariprofundus erugo]